MESPPPRTMAAVRSTIHALFVGLLPFLARGNVLELRDDNFESVTQASLPTGRDYFVAFTGARALGLRGEVHPPAAATRTAGQGTEDWWLPSGRARCVATTSPGLTSAPPRPARPAPWCGHCKRLAPTWAELDAKLKAESSPCTVAVVDAEQNSALASRFAIKGYPTVLLFSGGRVYKYKGARTVDDMEVFVRGGYREKAGQKVPAPPLLTDLMWKASGALFGEIVDLYRSRTSAAVVMTALALVTGLTVGFALGLVLAPMPKPRTAPARTAGPEDRKDQ